jgi:tRNA(Arg) A34 adenosine deaminase TadA
MLHRDYRILVLMVALLSSHSSPAQCAQERLLNHEFSKVIFGAWDEKAGAVGSIWDVLRDPRSIFKVEVSAGV